LALLLVKVYPKLYQKYLSMENDLVCEARKGSLWDSTGGNVVFEDPNLKASDLWFSRSTHVMNLLSQ